MTRRPHAPALLLAAATVAAAPLHAATPSAADPARALVLQTLARARLAPSDLQFKKDVVPDPNVPPFVARLLARPLDLFDAVEAADAAFPADPCAGAAPARWRNPGIRDWTGVPAPWRRPIETLAGRLAGRRDAFRALLGDAPQADRAAALRWASLDAFDTLSNADARARWGWASCGSAAMERLVRDLKAFRLDDADGAAAQLRAGGRIQPVRLRREVAGVLSDIRAFVTHVQTQGPAPPARPVALASALGPILLGGAGNDTHTQAAWLVIDPAGNDTYDGPGTANGLADRTLAVAIDLAGRDTWRQGAAGVWGAGVVWDQSGNDRYHGGDASWGAALFGAGALVDGGGDDQYLSTALGQGAALFGFGLLLDAAGNDTYTAGFQSQGFAGVNGLGVLIDQTGDDRYAADSLRPDSGRYPDRFLSLSQGFAIGMRPFAPGGVGLLIDRAGDDRYTADVFGQGASYWYAFGALIDHAGNDQYEACQYAQGHGVHLSAGALWDRSGNDVYQNLRGLAQGSAHDFATGLLWDAAGDDRYQSGGHSQGAAINNAAAILLDAGGNDRFLLEREREGGGQGFGEFAPRRMLGSVGVCVAQGGRDEWSTGAPRGVRVRGKIGAAAAPTGPSPRALPRGDRPRGRFLESGDWAWPAMRAPKPFGPVRTREAILAAGGDPALGRLLMRAASDDPEAAAARARIEALPPKAFAALMPWLGRGTVMPRVIADQVLEKRGRALLPVLRWGAGHPWDDIAGLCVYWLGESGGPADRPALHAALARPRLRPAALRSLVKLGAGARPAPPPPFLRSRRELERALALRALATAPDTRYGPFVPMLDDPDWNVRDAAAETLARGGPEARAALERRRGALGPLGRAWAPPTKEGR